MEMPEAEKPDDSGLSLARRSDWDRWRGTIDADLKTVKRTVDKIEKGQGALHSRITSAEKRIAYYAGGATLAAFALGLLVALLNHLWNGSC